MTDIAAATPSGPADPQPPAAPARTDRTRLLVALAVVLTSVGTLLLALVLGGGGPQPPLPGLPDPGLLTGWGLPLAKLAADLAAAGTVGALLIAGVLAPGKGRDLSGPGYRALLAATWWAVLWAAAVLTVLLLQMSDFIGTPVADVLDPVVLINYTRTVPQARALLVVAGLTVTLAIASRLAFSRTAALWLLAVALLAVVPPALTGHAASAGDHDLATSSLVLHVLAACVWVGGLLGLVLHLRRAPLLLSRAVPLFSRLALVCFAAVGLSGIANLTVRLDSVSQLVTTSYGVLALGKTALLVALGVLGWQHRQRTVPAVVAGRPGAFRRLAVVEVTVMAAAFGLAVALSRTPTPPTGAEETIPSAAERLLGYALPPLTPARLLTEWRPDALVLAIAVAAVWVYLAAVRRLVRRGGAWAWWRTGSFLSGVAVAVFVMTSGVGTYAMALFSVHMAQHMSLTMLVPILLAVGAPVTLALRALPSRSRDEPRGLREYLLAALHSRPAQVISHPLVALGLYVTSLYGLYYTPLFETAMRTHSAHLLMSAHFLAVGMVFFWPIIGADPTPRRLPHAARLLLLIVSMPLHAFFGVTLLGGSELIAEPWYRELALPWVDLTADQQVGGGIAWAAGELPTLLVLAAVLPQWFRADERAARRADRRADADGDAELAAYNAKLEALSRRR